MVATALSLLLAGCAGEPDATLLGVVLVPPKGVPAGVRPGVAQAKPAVPGYTPRTVPGAAPAEPETPDYLYDPDSPNKIASRAGAAEETVKPIGYAATVHSNAPLKDTAAVNKTETELRQLAQRNSSGSGRGLWNTKIQDLLNKRDHHIDDAIRKIEEDDDK